MVFKEFGKDVISLVKNYNTLNVMTKEQSIDVQQLVEDFNRLKKSGSLVGEIYQEQIDKVKALNKELNNDNLTNMFQQVAEGAENARVNIVDAYAAILDGNTHGLKNVQSIMNTFNNSFDGSVEKQKEFAKAVGQTNTSLSNYLSTVKTDGSASLTGYMGYLAKTTAKTIGLQAATLALNTALTMGISFGISLLAKAVNDAINAEQEAINKARESIESNKNQIESLEEIKQEYLEIIDSEKTYVEKTKEINKWKENLIKTYGFEKDALEKVNTERKTGIDLIDEEINRSRNLWLGENASQSQVAKSKIETDLFSNFTIQNSSVETKKLEENIRQNILDIFDYAKQEWDASNAFLNYDEQIVLGFNVDNIYDTKNKIEEALTSLGEIGYDNLSYQEKELSKQLNSHKEKIDKIIEDYGDIYTTFNEYTAQNLFAQFISQTGNQISLVTESNFEIWKNSLLKMAGESKPLQEALQKIINETFPQFSQESKKISPSIDSITRSTYNFVEVTEDLQKSLDDTFSNQSTLQSAFDKIQEGSSLSADDVRKLVELCKDFYPEIATAFTKTADGWTISAENIISANEKIVKSTKEEIQAQIDGYQKIIDTYNKNKLSPLVNNPSGMPSYVSSMYANLAQLASDAEEAQKQIDYLNLILQMFGLTTENQTKTLADYIKELSDTKSTVEEIKNVLDNNGTLTANDLQKAIEQYPQLENSLSAYLAGLKSQEDIYNELADCYNQDLDNFKTYLANKSIDDESTWDKFIENSGDWVNSLADMYALDLAHLKTYKQFSDELKNSISNNIPDSTAALAHYQNLERQSFEEFKGLFGDVEDIISESRDNSSSSSVTLPEEYTKLKKALEHEYAMGRKTAKEYYTELNSLAVKWLKGNAEYADEYMSVQETVYSGLKSLYSEVVNEQIEGYENVLEVLKNINQEKIDSLNKEKELLEDNADEEQRILDLKQAQLDLENAKKKTTWVITEQGLKQVQDEKSVKEAQDALDKLELESKTSQIDKKIKVLEDENDKYDKIKTDWQNKTNLEEAKKFIGSDNIKGAVSEGFKEGYINALNEKQSIDNSDKSTNKVSNPITIDDLLKKLGSKYTFEEIKDKAYNLAFSPYAFNSFADNVKTATENIVNNINNNSSKVGDINIVINDATDPEKVGNVVVKKLTDIATKWSNSSGRYLRSSY